jgi:hypothetical protein
VERPPAVAALAGDGVRRERARRDDDGEAVAAGGHRDRDPRDAGHGRGVVDQGTAEALDDGFGVVRERPGAAGGPVGLFDADEQEPAGGVREGGDVLGELLLAVQASFASGGAPG